MTCDPRVLASMSANCTLRLNPTTTICKSGGVPARGFWIDGWLRGYAIHGLSNEQ